MKPTDSRMVATFSEGKRFHHSSVHLPMGTSMIRDMFPDGELPS